MDAWVGDTIFIKEDGAVQPTNAPIERNGNVYRFTRDVNSTSTRFGLYIMKNGITVDGAGHMISGVIGYGVYFLSGEDIKIRNLKVKGFSNGVGTPHGNRIEVSNCTFEKTRGPGVSLSGLSNSVVVGNVFINTGIDAQLSAGHGNIVRDNIVNVKRSSLYRMRRIRQLGGLNSAS
ncbi:MAG: right-handed parallel beta-helix repeat-containing protein [Thermofilaceae archaeon]